MVVWIRDFISKVKVAKLVTIHLPRENVFYVKWKYHKWIPADIYYV